MLDGKLNVLSQRSQWINKKKIQTTPDNANEIVYLRLKIHNLTTILQLHVVNVQTKERLIFSKINTQNISQVCRN